jgi:hypothetical protein
MLTFLTEMAAPQKKDKQSLSAFKTKAGASCEGNEQAYNFRFVEVGEPSQGGEDTRSTIRSHVMRDYYEKKGNRRRPDTIPELSPAASQKEGVLQQTHRFKVGPEGLQEVKAGRKKSKGTSRTKEVTNEATNISEPEGSQVHPNSISRATHSHQPEPPAFAISDHWHEQQEGETSEYGLGSAAAPDTGIAIGDALLPPQCEEDSRNIAPPEKIYSVSGVIDPFNTLPILCVPRTEHLLHHGKSLSKLSVDCVNASSILSSFSSYRISFSFLCVPKIYLLDLHWMSED